VYLGSEKGYASSQSGDLIKLCQLTGMLIGALALNGIELNSLNLITPTEWKGQLPKEEVDRRIKRILKRKTKYPDHVSDAVGIGLFLQGEM